MGAGSGIRLIASDYLPGFHITDTKVTPCPNASVENFNLLSVGAADEGYMGSPPSVSHSDLFYQLASACDRIVHWKIQLLRLSRYRFNADVIKRMQRSQEFMFCPSGRRRAPDSYSQG